jgi:hypothetical protein
MLQKYEGTHFILSEARGNSATAVMSMQVVPSSPTTDPTDHCIQ